MVTGRKEPGEGGHQQVHQVLFFHPLSWDAANLRADKQPVVAGMWCVRDIRHNISAAGSVDVTRSEISAEQLRALQASPGLGLGGDVTKSPRSPDNLADGERISPYGGRCDVGRKDPGKIRDGFSDLLLPSAWWGLSSPSPLLALRLDSSQLRAATLEPSVCLSLPSVAMEWLPRGPLSPSISKPASWGSWTPGLCCTPHSRGLRKVRAISPHMTYARTPTRLFST